MAHDPGRYNSVRILSERFRETLRKRLGHTFAVGVPSRDFFVAVSLNFPEIIAPVGQRIRDDHRKSDHPLSEQLLLVSPDGVSDFNA